MRTTEAFDVLIRQLKDIFMSHNPSVDFDAPLPRTVVPKWMTIDVLETRLGRPERLVEASRFFSFEGHMMVCLPYMLLENNACAVLLVAPAETQDAAASPFYLHPRAWKLASLLVPVFVPCTCLVP